LWRNTRAGSGSFCFSSGNSSCNRTDPGAARSPAMRSRPGPRSPRDLSAGERELALYRLWNSWKPRRRRPAGGTSLRDVPAEEEDLGELVLLERTTRPPVWMRPDQRLDDGRQVEVLSDCPAAACPIPRGTQRCLLEPTREPRQRLRGERGQKLHQFETRASRPRTAPACSGERTVALRGEPVSRASSPITSPAPKVGGPAPVPSRRRGRRPPRDTRC